LQVHWQYSILPGSKSVFSKRDIAIQNLIINNLGWLQGVERIDSPNFSVRQESTTIELIIIHSISLPPAQFGGGFIQQLFCNQLDPNEHDYFAEISQMKVSAHFLIDRSGQVTQFVSCLDKAWHAGESNWHGRKNCNEFSLGIELEGTDEIAYTEVQYQQLADLIYLLQQHYSDIKYDALCGHCDISPGRKTDPGGFFDWTKLRSLLKDY